MQNSILEEMRFIHRSEKERSVAFPKTNYLFVEKYGRNMECEMDMITTLQGYEEWFLFRADWDRKPQGLYQELQVELQKHAKLGREFEGYIVISVAGQVDENEWEMMLEDLKEKEGKVKFIVSVSEQEKVQQIQEVMNRNFYTRVIEGEAYSAEEQLEILKDELEKYGFAICENQQNDILQYLSELSWRSEDNVRQKLQNTAKELIYSRMITQTQETRIFRKEELEKELNEIHKEDKKMKIGFSCSC